MEMRERIAKIIASEGLTASAFADLIGIQRSNVSHILNGRNGPSLEMLQKILNAFPHYNTEWLVMDKGDIYRKPIQTSIFDTIDDVIQSPTADANPERDETSIEELKNEQNSAPQNDVAPHIDQPASQPNEPSILPLAQEIVKRSADVKQIVVLYGDNTFSIYNKQ